MGNCRDCRYWEPLDYRPGMGDCLATKDGSQGFADNPLPESKALAKGEDGWSAVLETAPDFGCVQFEAREG